MPLFVVIIIVPPLSVFTVVVCGSVCVCVFVGGVSCLVPSPERAPSSGMGLTGMGRIPEGVGWVR